MNSTPVLIQQFDSTITKDTLTQSTIYRELGYYNQLPEATHDKLLNNLDSIQNTFLQEYPVEFTIQAIQNQSNEWIIYVLLILTFGFSVIWYYLPEKAFGMFKYSGNLRNFRGRESTDAETPGIIILLFFIANYIVSISLFIYLSVGKFNSVVDGSSQSFLWYLFAVVLAFYLARLFIIYSAGIAFNTTEAAARQIKLYVNTDNIIGIIMLPVLYLMLFTQLHEFLYIGLLVIFIFHIFKWFQSFLIGKTISGFSILHLFMYLCTLEIIPFIVLVKFFNTQLI